MTDRADLPCLRCARPLADATLRLEPNPTYVCECGLVYARELVDDADPVEWAKVVAGDGYRIDDPGGSTLTVTRAEPPTVAEMAGAYPNITEIGGVVWDSVTYVRHGREPGPGPDPECPICQHLEGADTGDSRSG